jgi:hypothetical protein
MISEKNVGPDEKFLQIRCLICGTYIDPHSLHNRQISLKITKIDQLFSPRVVMK